MVKSDPDRAKLLNIRYTGLQAYSIIEGYERLEAALSPRARSGSAYL